MAGAIGSQPAAVGSRAATLPPQGSIASSSRKSSTSCRTSSNVKNLSFNGSKEVLGDSVLFPTSGKTSYSKSQRAGRGATLQVRANVTSGWFTGLVDKIAHHDTQQSKDNVTYGGVVTISKKRAKVTNLVQLDLIDSQAAIVDLNAELTGKKVEVLLVSKDLDPSTNAPKVSAGSSVQNWVSKGDLDLVADEDEYPIKFTVPKDFGEPGAIIVRNHHPNEFYIKTLSLQCPDQTILEFPANAWVHNSKKYPKDRVFFTNEDYLPCHTPAGLKALRGQELEQYRGNGTGQRQPWDRIYDYDVYNDLGNPDKSIALARPVLGGSQDSPYPRRIRTGRPMSKADPKTESAITTGAGSMPYLPSDEFFLRTKNSTFVAGLLKGVLHSVVPNIQTKQSVSFKSVKEVKDLYTKGVGVDLPDTVDISALTPEVDDDQGSLVYINQLFDSKGQNRSILNYAVPQVIADDDEAWRTDEEFGRQTLAGLHPTVIQRMKAYPPTSALDPAEYGEGTALTDKHILPYLEGLSVAQAIEAKKLFIIDYHDAILPLITEVNADTAFGYKSYAPRTIFFHTSAGTMKPIAIELSLPPPQKGGAASNRVFTPADAADHLWDLAKFHANAIDSNYHQVVSHFTFAHACMEPIIIASYRQLSEMHPMKTLLKPYFKDTIPINAAARAALINAGGNVESNFTMGKHAFQVGTKGYGAFWRFDTQGLPQNLIARGMAEPADSSYPGSVKLVVEDYPYAKDGLEVWDAIYEWIAKCVEIIYQGSDEAVQQDTELQAWWKEVVNVGHGDHKDATWWPKLDSTKNLVQTLSTIAWIAGPYHAAVNFGQYAYAGFPLNKPSGTRRLVPEKGSAEYKALQQDPEKFYLSTISSASKALSVMTTIELLATHSVDEEYIGTRDTTNWTANLKVKEAFSDFAQNIAEVEANIRKRNKDKALVNRRGPANVPYTLLIPTSTSGLTGRGIPYSVSI